jgi:hypothetical protein
LARSENDAHPCASPSGSAIGIGAHTGLKSENQSTDAVQFRTLPRQTRAHKFTKTQKNNVILAQARMTVFSASERLPRRHRPTAKGAVDLHPHQA